jgi:hypothetical protein
VHWQELLKSFQFPVYRANGTDLLDVYAKSQEAIGYARARKRPCMVVFDDVPRRFGHAATDRQNAYLQQEQIDEAQARNPMEVNRSFLPTPGFPFCSHLFDCFSKGTCAQAVAAGITSYEELLAIYNDTIARTENAFVQASKEPKITSRSAV